MPAVSGGYAREAEQSIGEHLTVRQDVRLGIAGNLGLPEGLNSTQIRFHRPAVLRRLNGHDERDIVLGPATALARPLSAQVGIIEFDALRQRLMALVFSIACMSLCLSRQAVSYFTPNSHESCSAEVLFLRWVSK